MPPRPKRVALLSSSLHYHALTEADAAERDDGAEAPSSARAAAVYGYERLLYANPRVDVVLAASLELAASFDMLQKLALTKADRETSDAPLIKVLPVKTRVDADALVAGPNAAAHVASFANRSSALFVAAPGRGNDLALRWLLRHWRDARGQGCEALRGATVVVTGAPAWKAVVDDQCANEFETRAAEAATRPATTTGDDDDAPKSLADVADLERSDPGSDATSASDAAFACSAAYAPLDFEALQPDEQARVSPLERERVEIARLARDARVLLAPSLTPNAETTRAFLALEHGLPVLAPRNSTVGGLADAATGDTIVNTGNGVSPVAFYDDGTFGAELERVFCDAPTWRRSAHAALELALHLSSHSDWTNDPDLQTLLRGTTDADDCGHHPRHVRTHNDVSLDASLLDALKLAVRLDDAAHPATT